MAPSEYLVNLLTLEPHSSRPNTFIAPPAAEVHVRAFGGRTVAQALVAAGNTVEADRYPHSLHSYFLRPGASREPMECRVEILRDGRSFSSRRVTAIQSGREIFEMLASFHSREDGPVHQELAPMAPDPESLPNFEERFRGRSSDDDMARWFFRAEPFDVRYVHTSPFEGAAVDHPAAQQLWFRAKSLPSSSLFHAAALSYASDMTILDPVLLRHGFQWTDRSMLGATLDHSIWFHHPVAFDQWVLFDQSSSTAGNGRALATAKLWGQTGTLLATVTQEALMRPIQAPVVES